MKKTSDIVPSPYIYIRYLIIILLHHFYLRSIFAISSQIFANLIEEMICLGYNLSMKINEIIPFSKFESTEIDYKLHLDKNDPVSWAKSIAAFGCREGGLIIVGVDNSGNVAGISYEEVDDSKNLVYRIIDRMVKPGIVPVRFETKKLEDSDRYLLIIHIGKGHQLLFIRNGDYSETIYSRKDGLTVPASVEEIKWMFYEQRSFSFDSEPTRKEYSPSDFAMLSAYYEEEFPEEGGLTKSILISIGAITPEGHLTRGGELFTDKCSNPNANCHCRLWPGKDKGDDFAVDDKEFQGNLLSLYDFMMNFIQRHTSNGLLKIDGGHKRLPAYPKRALEEALWNAIAHRDYLIDGGQIDIDIFKDRIEICSPGSFLPGNIGEDTNLAMIPSRRRNNVICDILALVNKMQRNGSGFRKIVAEYKDERQSKKPKLFILPTSVLITLYDIQIDRAQNLLLPEMSKKELKFAEQILDACSKEPKSSSELLSYTDYKSKNSLMNNIIKPLIKAGLLENTEPNMQSRNNKFVKKIK